MKTLLLPSAGYLRVCLLYEKESGKLFWKKRPRKHFVSQKEFLRWNTRHAGKPAHSSRDKSGHARVTVDKTLFLTHRVIWKLMTGKEPKHLIDHKDRNPENNRWKNLRQANDAQSVVNRRMFCNNTSGCTGVVFSKQHNQWRAGLYFECRRIELGLFDIFENAVAARQRAVKKFHGEFAP